MNNKKIGKETDEEVLIQTALSKYGRRAYDTSIATVKQAKTKITQRKFSLKK